MKIHFNWNSHYFCVIATYCFCFVIWIFFFLMGHVLGIPRTPAITLVSGLVTIVTSALLARVKPFSRIRL